MNPERETRIKGRIQDFPASTRKAYLRAVRGRSRKAAIRMRCIMCVGYKISDVAACTDDVCPLWPYRMGDVRSK